MLRKGQPVNDVTASTATHESELLKTIYSKRSLSEIADQLPKPRFNRSRFGKRSVKQTNYSDFIEPVSATSMSIKQDERSVSNEREVTRNVNATAQVSIQSNDYVSNQ